MKDILKVGAMYFSAAVSTLAGIGVGLKICDRLTNSDSKSNTKKAEEESK